MSSKVAIDDFLAQRSIGVVGVSRDGHRGFGNAVRKHLAARGYEVHVVHPEAERIGEHACARSLDEIATKVGGVVLVTPPGETEKLVAQAAALRISRVWMQPGAESPAAVRACEEHGIAVVHDECILVRS